MRLKPEHPALSEARTIHTKYVFDAADYEFDILKKANNIKLLEKGIKVITKGIWKDLPIYTLTLEERATCSSDCEHWDDCYGNNVGMAHRFKANQALMDKMEIQLESISKKNPLGFVIRLHILGDFYSMEYVWWWSDMLERYPHMRIYGYTRWHPHTPIGMQVDVLRKIHPDRFKIRFSNLPSDNLSANSEEITSEGITCPVQVNKTKSCGTCGLCWTTKKPIRFLTH